jgi:hypothetical protein
MISIPRGGCACAWSSPGDDSKIATWIGVRFAPEQRERRALEAQRLRRYQRCSELGQPGRRAPSQAESRVLWVAGVTF